MSDTATCSFYEAQAGDRSRPISDLFQGDCLPYINDPLPGWSGVAVDGKVGSVSVCLLWSCIVLVYVIQEVPLYGFKYVILSNLIERHL